MKKIIPNIAAMALAVCIAFPAAADMPSIVVDPDPYVADELIGTWRVVAVYNNDTGLIDPVYEDGANIRITYVVDGFQINGGCAPSSGGMLADDGFYETLGDTAASTRLCPGYDEDPIRRFSAAYPTDGYYHVINDRLHLFSLDGDLRVSLLRNPR